MHPAKPKLEIPFAGQPASGTADVQSLVELFVQFLLLGIKYRHLMLFSMFSCGRKIAGHETAGCGISQWTGVAGRAVQKRDAAEDPSGEKN